VSNRHPPGTQVSCTAGQVKHLSFSFMCTSVRYGRVLFTFTHAGHVDTSACMGHQCTAMSAGALLARQPPGQWRYGVIC
jgi:hypothetical protein